MTLKIKRCNNCPFCKAERIDTGDWFEMAFDWFCAAEENKKIMGYVEAFDDPKIPDWCPLRKADMIDDLKVEATEA